MTWKTYSDDENYFSKKTADYIEEIRRKDGLIKYLSGQLQTAEGTLTKQKYEKEQKELEEKKEKEIRREKLISYVELGYYKEAIEYAQKDSPLQAFELLVDMMEAKFTKEGDLSKEAKNPDEFYHYLIEVYLHLTPTDSEKYRKRCLLALDVLSQQLKECEKNPKDNAENIKFLKLKKLQMYCRAHETLIPTGKTPLLTILLGEKLNQNNNYLKYESFEEIISYIAFLFQEQRFEIRDFRRELSIFRKYTAEEEWKKQVFSWVGKEKKYEDQIFKINNEVTQLSSEIKLQKESIREKNGIVQEKKSEIRQLEKSLEGKGKEVEKLKEQLRQKDELLQQKDSEIDNLTKQVQQLQKTQKIETLFVELKNKISEHEWELGWLSRDRDKQMTATAQKIMQNIDTYYKDHRTENNALQTLEKIKIDLKEGSNRSWVRQTIFRRKDSSVNKYKELLLLTGVDHYDISSEKIESKLQ